MEKLKQYRFLKKVKKMLDAPARPEEDYDDSGTSSTMFIGAATPRSAGHFANGIVSLRQNQVKDITVGMLGLIDVLERGGGNVRDETGPLFIELDVRFQELDLGLLFTDQEKVERSWAAAVRRKESASASTSFEGAAGLPPRVQTADLEGMRAQIAQWMKEQLERKRRLYKIETMVRDLGVNVNDVRCRGLERDRKGALAKLKENTGMGVKMLREVMGTLEGFAAAGGQ